jgi:hypothetical protein
MFHVLFIEKSDRFPAGTGSGFGTTLGGGASMFNTTGFGQPTQSAFGSTTAAGFGSVSRGGLFGQPASSASIFGGAASTPFGQTQTPAFGALLVIQFADKLFRNEEFVSCVSGSKS